MSQVYDIAVVGSGFAGSLMAMIACRLGRSVILIERGRHPRFVIGESSTPLSNLLLEDLANRYDLPALRPLAKWGSWQRSYPDITCGLKRGFTFYHHTLGQRDAPDPDHLKQLLVAASPHDEIADTHWYRPDFDELLVGQVQCLGVDYLDEVKLEALIESGGELVLTGQRFGREVALHARFVVDATGPRGFLHRALALPEAALADYPPTQALYSHFSGVARLDSTRAVSCDGTPPFPVDDAAVHHVFDGGWVWVLRFNNGRTSAGVAAAASAAAELRLSDGEPAWRRLLELIPCLKEQFAKARTEQPFTYVPHLSFLSGRVTGAKWTLLPSAAGFIDPLLSTGFPLTLLGIQRLANIFEHEWNSPRLTSALTSYSEQTVEELLATSRLIASLYATMNNFAVFTSLSLLYFAAATYSETVRRLQKPHLARSFLLHDHPIFGPACRDLLDRARGVLSEKESADLARDILRTIEPIDVAGLCNPRQHNWYPVDGDDLFRSAARVEATREEIAAMLDSCGFYQRNASPIDAAT